MPEHRSTTPPALRELESFLWHDIEAEAAWLAWLRHRKRLTPEATGSFAAAMQLHRALRTLQVDNAALEVVPKNGLAARRQLDQLVDRLGVRPFVEADGVRLASSNPDDVAASLLADALESMRSSVWERFKLCGEPTCRASFYDASKAAGKIWCEMATCGSRNKMRRYRGKQ